MLEAVFGITATAVLVVALAGLVERGPMNHRWDWPWHGWWHSGWEHTWLHQDCRTVTETERLPAGQVITRTIESCSR